MWGGRGYWAVMRTPFGGLGRFPVTWVTVTTRPLIVTVAVRVADGLLAGEITTVPVPVPAAPDAMVSHVALDVAVQLQLAGAVTPMVALLVFPSTVRLVGVAVTAHGAEAACVTTTERPATVNVADRDVVPAFGVAVTVNEPLPVLPALTVSHVAGLLVVQAQPDVVVTVPELVPPLDPIDMVVGETVKLQAEAPAWLIVTVCPPTVT